MAEFLKAIFIKIPIALLASILCPHAARSYSRVPWGSAGSGLRQSYQFWGTGRKNGMMHQTTCCDIQKIFWERSHLLWCLLSPPIQKSWAATRDQARSNFKQCCVQNC